MLVRCRKRPASSRPKAGRSTQTRQRAGASSTGWLEPKRVYVKAGGPREVRGRAGRLPDCSERMIRMPQKACASDSSGQHGSTARKGALRADSIKRPGRTGARTGGAVARYAVTCASEACPASRSDHEGARRPVVNRATIAKITILQPARISTTRPRRTGGVNDPRCRVGKSAGPQPKAARAACARRDPSKVILVFHAVAILSSAVPCLFSTK